MPVLRRAVGWTRWLPGGIRRVALLEARGALTVADVRGARDDQEYQRSMRAWAACVWAAYAPQHALARDYLAAVRRMLDGSAGGSAAT
jgi:hypothetical protein